MLPTACCILARLNSVTRGRVHKVRSESTYHGDYVLHLNGRKLACIGGHPEEQTIDDTNQQLQTGNSQGAPCGAARSLTEYWRKELAVGRKEARSKMCVSPPSVSQAFSALPLPLCCCWTDANLTQGPSTCTTIHDKGGAQGSKRAHVQGQLVGDVVIVVAEVPEGQARNQRVVNASDSFPQATRFFSGSFCETRPGGCDTTCTGLVFVSAPEPSDTRITFEGQGVTYHRWR